jgi:hypothetical protein
MKINIHILSNLAHFFLEWEMFRTKVVETIKTTFCGGKYFFSENRAVCEIMWKYIVERGKGPQLTIWPIRIACWISRATNTHTPVVQYSLLFHYNNGYTSAPHCHVIRSLSSSTWRSAAMFPQWGDHIMDTPFSKCWYAERGPFPARPDIQIWHPRLYREAPPARRNSRSVSICSPDRLQASSAKSDLKNR